MTAPNPMGPVADPTTDSLPTDRERLVDSDLTPSQQAALETGLPKDSEVPATENGDAPLIAEALREKVLTLSIDELMHLQVISQSQSFLDDRWADLTSVSLRDLVQLGITNDLPSLAYDPSTEPLRSSLSDLLQVPVDPGPSFTRDPQFGDLTRLGLNNLTQLAVNDGNSLLDSTQIALNDATSISSAGDAPTGSIVSGGGSSFVSFSAATSLDLSPAGGYAEGGTYEALTPSTDKPVPSLSGDIPDAGASSPPISPNLFAVGPVSDSDATADGVLAGRIDITNYSATNQGFTVAARQIDGFGDLTGPSPADIYQNWSGLGVLGSTGRSAPASQLGYSAIHGVSEELIFEFDTPLVDATVTVAALFAIEGPSGEEGHWEAFEEGIIVGQSDFHTARDSSMTFAIDLGGVTFDRLVFSANEYIGGQSGITNNSSDYYVRSIDYNYSVLSTVSEYATNGMTVGITALATDADAGDRVTYNLTDDAGGRFAIDANSGVITVADNTLLDYETSTNHSVTVLATSSDGSTSPQSFVVNLTNAIEGGPGSEALNGTAGDDVIVGFGGSDTLTGSGGNDIVIWDATDTVIDGGTGTDTLRLDGGDAGLTIFGGTITGIERIDMEADAVANTLTLAAQDVLDLSNNDTLTVLGNAGDSVNAGTGWTDGGLNDAGYHVYTQMVIGDLASLILDSNISVNPDIVA